VTEFGPPDKLYLSWLRFVGLDVHKDYITVAIIDHQLNVVMPPRKVSIHDFPTWARKNLKAGDLVVLEATSNAWRIVDILRPLVGRVTVAHPYATKAMMSGRVKTDGRDALKLARLLAGGLIDEVWVPTAETRELRALVTHRLRLIRQRSQARNRLQSLLHRHNLLPPSGGLFSAANSDWWQSLPLPSSEALRVRHDLAILTALEPLITEAESELVGLSIAEPWARQVPFLVQVAGIGVLSAMTILSAIGDIARFPTAKKLVGYSGLGVAVHRSGQTHHTGAITKQGRKELRTTMIQCAWRAVDTSAYWKKQFEHLSPLIGKNKAIVAIARKLLVVIWHVLSGQVADQHADPEKVALKFMDWANDLRLSRRGGLTAAAFAGRQLRVVRLGEALLSVSRSGRTYRLVPDMETGQGQID
jgi:transposase